MSAREKTTMSVPDLADAFAERQVAALENAGSNVIKMRQEACHGDTVHCLLGLKKTLIGHYGMDEDTALRLTEQRVMKPYNDSKQRQLSKSDLSVIEGGARSLQKGTIEPPQTKPMTFG